MSIPQVTQSQIDAMNRIAEEKYGVKNEPYEEPVQEEQEPVVEEQIEYEQEPEEQEDEIEEQAEELYPVKKKIILKSFVLEHHKQNVNEMKL